MMICPRCHAPYADGVGTCAVDGSPLLRSLELGRFRIEHPLHDATYVATSIFLEKRRALTLIPGGLDDRRARELRAAARLRSPNLVEIQDYGVEDGFGYVVTELLSGHALHDELDDPPREVPAARVGLALGAAMRGLRQAHAVGLVHGALTPRRVFLANTRAGEVGVVLGLGLGPPVAPGPYTPPEHASGEVTPAWDVYAVAVMYCQARTGGMRPPDPAAVPGWVRQEVHDGAALVDALARAVDPDPARRPSLDELCAAISELSAAAPRVASPFVPDDPVERDLLAALRARPADEATRAVYSDWLESHGYRARAELLRRDPEAALDEDSRARSASVDPTWRALASRAPIDRCTFQLAYECPKRWDALTPTTDDTIRFCARCQQNVYFCTSVEEARAHGERGACIAIDAAVARGAALPFDREARLLMPDRPILMGEYLPPIEPRKPGVLARIASWFRR